MSEGQFHISPDGPKPCHARTDESCKYGNGGHYGSMESAEIVYAKEFRNDSPLESNSKHELVASNQTLTMITLELDLGAIEVVDGDLSTAKVRSLFANGLCFDLAKEVARKTGGEVYFTVDSEVTDKELDKAVSQGNIHELMYHAVVQSPEDSGKFLDAYGVQSEDSVKGFFTGGEGKLVKAKQEWMDAMPSKSNEVNLSKFAETVGSMSKNDESYSYWDFE